MVVLLRPSEKKRLQKLAKEKHVSSGEIMRQSLQSFDTQPSDAEQEMLATLLKEMNIALDHTLVSIRSARSEIQENLRKIQEMREARP